MASMTKEQRDRIIVGERPKVSTDVIDDSNIRYNWKTSLLAKNVNYHVSRCVGCTLCTPCPWEAITMGPVQEVAAKRIEGAPLILIDEDKCTFCGLCDSACIFHAIEAGFGDVPASAEYERLDGTHRLDEKKCKPCLLCEKLCPREAIKVNVKVTPKTKLIRYQDPKAARRVADGHPDAKGTITIDENKCTWCGLCELLCPECIKIYWTEGKPKPPQFVPAAGIRVDTTRCDYCGLCQTICPSDAVKVTCQSSPPRIIREPHVEGKMTIDDGLCIDCTLCSRKCPYKALEVTPALTGKVNIEHLERCDPTGCVNCFNICPTKAIYATGDKDKLAVNEDLCVKCGACENACPEHVLKVTREAYQLSQLKIARGWERGRARRFYDSLVHRPAAPSGLYERAVKAAPIANNATINVATNTWSAESAQRKQAQARIQSLQQLLKQNRRLLISFERGQLEPLLEALKDAKGEKTKREANRKPTRSTV
jgi:4Fe-4S ferredoxin